MSQKKNQKPAKPKVEADEQEAISLLSGLPETPEPPSAPKSSAPASATQTPLTKTEAVRQAIAAGKDKPTEGCQWIREKFYLVVAPNLFSTLKAQIQKGEKQKAAKEAPKAAATNTDGVDLARKVKALVAEYGAEQVTQMAAVFGE